MAERHVAVLYVERPEADLAAGNSDIPSLACLADASFGSDRYGAFDGGDYSGTCAALMGIGFVPYDQVLAVLEPATSAVPVAVQIVTAPELAPGCSGGADWAIQFDDAPVFIGGGQEFTLEGKDYDETCAALRGGGFGLHENLLDALSQATVGR